MLIFALFRKFQPSFLHFEGRLSKKYAARALHGARAAFEIVRAGVEVVRAARSGRAGGV